MRAIIGNLKFGGVNRALSVRDKQEFISFTSIAIARGAEIQGVEP